MERSNLPDESGDTDAARMPTQAHGGSRPAPEVTVLVCTTCRSDADGATPSDGAAFAEAAAALVAPGAVAVRGVRCLANCKRSLSAAMVRTDGWTYVFGDLAPEAAGDLIAGAHLLAGSADGLMPWRGRPDCLKRGMVARIPPLNLSEEP